jgi:hypothetical protein
MMKVEGEMMVWQTNRATLREASIFRRGGKEPFLTTILRGTYTSPFAALGTCPVNIGC